MSPQEQQISEVVEQFDPIDELYDVDQETGEMRPVRPVDGDDLPRLIEAVKYRVGHIESLKSAGHPINLYIEKLQRRRDDQIDSIQKSVDFLASLCQSIVDASGEKSVHIPGVGRARYRNLPVSVDTTGYDGMTDDEKASLHKEYGDLFRVVTKVNPDKKAILEILKGDGTVYGFCLNTKPPVFEVKPE